jgi:hypothetical protein
MGNNGTGYDKHVNGCRCCGDTEYSRQFRDNYAIEDSLSEGEVRYKKAKKAKSAKTGWGGGKLPIRSRNRRGPEVVSEECKHAWIEREKWFPHDPNRYYGYSYGYNKTVPLTKMVLKRVWVCFECRKEQVIGDVQPRPSIISQNRRQRWVRSVYRDMTKQESLQYNKKVHKKERWYPRDFPTPYGVKEDGKPITRNEFKQAPKKRLERKRPDEEAA